MKTKVIKATVVECLKTTLEEMGFSHNDVSDSTRLVGKDAVLSSLGLVSLIVNIEQKLSDDFGLIVIIADERAMSQVKSPFRSVGSLSAYIEKLISEGDEL
jgi:acyl carrier protein